MRVYSWGWGIVHARVTSRNAEDSPFRILVRQIQGDIETHFSRLIKTGPEIAREPFRRDRRQKTGGRGTRREVHRAALPKTKGAELTQPRESRPGPRVAGRGAISGLPAG